MFKNLSAAALGITGRQSELIELALTYGFRGFDIDMEDFVKRVRNHGLSKARRFIESAHIKIGEFELPMSWRGEEAMYKASLASLPESAEIAASLGATRCYTTVTPASDDLPYHENFELHRRRLAEIAGVLARRDIRLGLQFFAAPSRREGKQHEFIHQAEPLLLLIQSIGAANVGLAFDTWNWHFGGGGFDQLRELSAGEIVSVRLADAPDNTDPLTVSEKHRLLPGEKGGVDCSGALSALAGLGYKGPVTAHPDPRRLSGMTRDAIVQRAASALDEQWRAAGLSKSGKTPTPAEAK